MRTGLLLLILLVGLQSFAQSPSTPDEIIQRAITSGILDGHLIKLVGPMGDAAAVAITRVVGGSALKPSQIETILAILTHSFADLRLVASASDRQPRTTLFVLRSLSETADPKLRDRIAEVREYVENQYKEYKLNAARRK